MIFKNVFLGGPGAPGAPGAQGSNGKLTWLTFMTIKQYIYFVLCKFITIKPKSTLNCLCRR